MFAARLRALPAIRTARTASLHESWTSNSQSLISARL
jgi:hypothetical protein